MGQKVHPIGFRLGFIKSWDSRWYAEKDYPQLLIEDIRVREFLKKKLYHAGVSKIEIERAASKAKKAKVTIYTARPGIIIGKKGIEVSLVLGKQAIQTWRVCREFSLFFSRFLRFDEGLMLKRRIHNRLLQSFTVMRKLHPCSKKNVRLQHN